ncbi:MAG: hypothetical protein WKF57_06485 [Nakamurella sp.]
MTEQSAGPPAYDLGDPFDPERGAEARAETELGGEAGAESLTDLLAVMAADQYRDGDRWALYRQDTWWTTSRGVLAPIEILTHGHRLNIARMLLRTAAGQYAAYQEDLLLRYQKHELTDLTPDALEDQPAILADPRNLTDPLNPPWHATDQDALVWMCATVLYRRIVRGLPDPARPASGSHP